MSATALCLNKKESHELAALISYCNLSLPLAHHIVGSWRDAEKKRGIYWLVKYLKAVKIHILSGTRDPLYLPKSGPYRGQMKWVYELSKKGRVGKRNALKIVNLYGRWTAPEPTEYAYRLFRDSVGVEVSENVKDLPLTEIFDLPVSLQAEFSRLSRGVGFKTSPLRMNSSHYTFGGKTKDLSEMTPWDELHAMHDAPMLFNKHVALIRRSLRLPEEISKRETSAFHCYIDKDDETYDEYVGKVVGLVKDRGLKVRFIANLAKGWQVCLSPFTSLLKKYLRTAPESALFDQEGAVDWMVCKLQEGCKITSVDLTQATDFMPVMKLYEALDFLTSTVDNRDVLLSYNLDKDLSDCVYRTKYPACNVVYRTGQAMGRWPSKYELDLFMILMARKAGACGDTCRINGDDIFFTDGHIASKFLKILKRLEIPISETKTFLSKDFGEFSGKIADAFGSLEIYKAGVTSYVKDPLGLIRRYGDKAIKGAPKDLQPVLRLFSSLSRNENGLGRGKISPLNVISRYLPDLTVKKKGSNHTQREGYSQGVVEQMFSFNSWVSSMEDFSSVEDDIEVTKQWLGNRSLRPYTRKILKRKLKRQLRQKRDVERERSRNLELAYNKQQAKGWFDEPVYALNDLIDHVNSLSEVIVTSDGVVLEEVEGELDGIYKGLTKARLQDYSTSPMLLEKTSSKVREVKPISYVKRIYKKLRFASRLALVSLLSFINRER